MYHSLRKDSTLIMLLSKLSKTQFMDLPKFIEKSLKIIIMSWLSTEGYKSSKNKLSSVHVFHVKKITSKNFSQLESHDNIPRLLHGDEKNWRE